MARLPRIVVPGVAHHITQRGNRRGQTFFSDLDYRTYLWVLRQHAARSKLEVLGYCLMPNHVHLVAIPASSDALHRTLKPVHGIVATRVNRRLGWQGHLWQGRFFSCALDEHHLWAALRYVERNPVRAGLVATAERYRWSSAAAHCGIRRDPLLTPCPSWKEKLDSIESWSAWLRDAEDPGENPVRAATARGVPCGSSEFVTGIALTTGRTLEPRLKGRPRKSATGATLTR